LYLFRFTVEERRKAAQCPLCGLARSRLTAHLAGARTAAVQ